MYNEWNRRGNHGRCCTGSHRDIKKRKTKKNWLEGIKKAMSVRELREKWKDGEKWEVGIRQLRKTF
jgi:hypothetical protein